MKENYLKYILNNLELVKENNLKKIIYLFDFELEKELNDIENYSYYKYNVKNKNNSLYFKNCESSNLSEMKNYLIRKSKNNEVLLVDIKNLQHDLIKLDSIVNLFKRRRKFIFLIVINIILLIIIISRIQLFF